MVMSLIRRNAGLWLVTVTVTSPGAFSAPPLPRRLSAKTWIVPAWAKMSSTVMYGAMKSSM
jgi:hypothetical protein